MRILLMFSVSFSLACLLVILAEMPVWSIAVLAILWLVAVFFSRKRSVQLRIISCGLGVLLGLVWTMGYHQLIVKPAEALDGEFVSVTGCALEYSKVSNYGSSVTAEIEVGELSTRAVVYLSGDEQLSPGDRFSVKAQLRDASTDGSYYNHSEGIYLLAYGKTTPEIIPAERISLHFWPAVMARRLKEAIIACVPEDILGCALGLTLGDRSLLSALTVEHLKRSGIYHALALSGMHMSTLAGFVSICIRNKRLRAIICIPVCVLFTLITGASSSLVRALIMECLLLIAPLFGRETDVPTSLGFAALLMLLQNPWCILGWGTQLSFASVAGIAICSEPLQQGIRSFNKKHHIPKRKHKLTYGLFGSLGTSLSAMLFTVPLMMVYFGMVSLIAPLTNLLTGVFITWAFRLGLLAALIGCILPGVGSLLGSIVALLLRYILWVSESLSRIPFGVVYTDSSVFTGWILLCYLIIGFLCISPRRRLLIPVCCIVGSLMLCIGLNMVEHAGTELIVLDVGQGQCLVARSGDQTVMIDCGSSSDRTAGHRAAAYLDQIGEPVVDILLLTHYDNDHVNGVTDLLSLVQVNSILMPVTEAEIREEIALAAAEAGTAVQYVTENTSLLLSAGKADVYAAGDGRDANSSGLAVYLSMDNLDVLVTGDMDILGEKRLMHFNDLTDVDILVAGHHGAADSTSQALLEQVKPEIVVISVGENNYGHPRAETVSRIRSAGAYLYRTDLHGTLELKGA